VLNQSFIEYIEEKGWMTMPFSLPVQVNPVKIGSKPKEIYYPQTADLPNQVWEQKINRSIARQVQNLIDEPAGNQPETVVEMIGTYEIKNNQREVLSLSLSNYAYHDRAAHGMTFIKSLTFDMKKERQVQLADLFKPGSDYIARLSAIVRAQIDARKIQLISDFTAIHPHQDFYVADRTLVIYFQLYEITPYVFGFPFFPISVYDIQDIIDEAGPLGRLAEHN